MDVVLSLGLNGPYWGIEGCQVIIYVYILLNLVKIRGINRTCKVGNLSSFLGKKVKKIMNSNHRLVPFFQLLQNNAVLNMN
jgi:hypothetical protein